jgi:phosphate starvation-inducible PhoH-like protein
MGSKLRSSQISSYVPKTENQKQYVSLLDNAENKVVVVLGPAGTGKTLFACLNAIKDLKAGVINRIVITRPVVPVEEEDIGFLPGNLRNKMDPWIRPIFDIFLEFYSQRDIDTMVKTGVIEIAPLAFMRGRTFKRCFILADEMQNSSPSQMLMLMTRIGEGSRMVVGGDLHQSDRKLLGSGSGSGVNGLSDFLSRYTTWIERNKVFSLTKEWTQEGMQEGTHLAVCELSIADVERSPVVSQILDIFSDVSYLPDSGELLAEDRSSGSRGPNEKKSATYYNGIPGVNLSGQVENDSALIPKKDFYNKFGVGKEDL